ncbi:TNFAIP3-interacting protein 1-like isoform X20 [Salvelinus alpinus]|uniref:TNFAIP3-interacting protein 1-like isoform X20 n=1 Tax=Salvelinus alpinus TaxID=8036 RepID=UPI0039FC72F8
MEGKGPYRIYDPGGGEAKAREAREEGSSVGESSYRLLLEENSVLRDRMKGLKSLGQGKLHRQPSMDQRPSQSCLSTEKALHHDQPSEGLSEFEVVNMEEKTSDTQTAGAGTGQFPQENQELTSQLQRLESSFSIFAEASNPNQLLAHLGRMAVEFHHLSSKVQKNEQRTSLLQTLCEQLRQENNELRKKMEEDLQYRNGDVELLRPENLKLKEQVTGAGETAAESEGQPEAKEEVVKEETASVRSKMEVSTPQKRRGNATEKAPAKPCDPEAYEKKIKLLEKQRKDVLDVNKQWDVQWNSMKSQFEQKITDLRQRLADSQKAVQELEAEREQRQRDYDKKLLLAKSKIENVQGEKECLNSETTELKKKVRYLQDQLLPLSKQREYQEKEIQRLNRVSIVCALEKALNLHPPPSSQQPPRQGTSGNHDDRPSDLITVLKEQVKIFEEDFRKERSDRERMNEEKEDLRRQVERLQGQVTNLTNQAQRERGKLERLQMQHHKQGQQQQERRTSDPPSGTMNGPLSPHYCGPFTQVAPGGGPGQDVRTIHHQPRILNIAAAADSVAQTGHGDFTPVRPRGSRWASAGDGSRPPPENMGTLTQQMATKKRLQTSGKPGWKITRNQDA